MRRIMIGGTGSGCGKTTVTCALLSAFKRRGTDVCAFKCGPDYIDPMFHKNVIGAPSYNLDSFFMSDDRINASLAENGGDLAVIEGVMGFYDGIDFSFSGSSHEISRITDTAVVLVADCSGASLSVMASVRGFADFTENNIAGVIFNNLPERLYGKMSDECRKIGLEPFGFLPRIKEARVGSRRLGLVSAEEISDLKEKMRILGEYAEKYIDMDALLRAAERETRAFSVPKINKISDVRIAVARDRAFCFYYDDNFKLLTKMGAKLVFFSPLANEPVPECDGLILGGGYPELNAHRLEQNAAASLSVREAIGAGMPCIAECGGFMYLHESMEDENGEPHKGVGVIKGKCVRTNSLRHFGYMEMTALRDNILCGRGHKIRAHEFHYYDTDCREHSFEANKNGETWECVVTSKNLFAGFPHIHFGSDVTLAENFLKSCEEYKCTR